MNVEAEGMPIKKLLGSGEYIIPNYQREYDWGLEEINELLDDIKDIDKGDSYFIGHMVLDGKRNGETFVVVDGQQRITTITIMLCCLRDIFYARKENSLGNGINNNYIFFKDVNDHTSARLSNDMPYPVLQARVLNVPEHKNNNVIPQKNGEKKIIKAYEHIRSLFEKYTKEELEQIRDKILNLETVAVYAEDVTDACTIFMTLNSTGKDLTAFDLVKSLIFSRYKKIPLVDEPNDTWKTIISNTQQNIKFLNNFYASRYKKVSDRRLFKEIDKTIKKLNPKKIEEGTKVFLQQMLEDSSIFKLINEPISTSFNKNEYEIYESVYAIIKQFKIQVANSFLIALIREYRKHTIAKKECIKVLSAMERFHFVNNAVCSKRSSGRDLMYAKYARELYQVGTKHDKHIVIRNLCLELNHSVADISDFEASVDSKLYYTKKDEKQKELVKYVLMKLERKKNLHSIPIATSIEHVYPETPEKMTLKDSTLIRNIGNLVLLEDDVNSKIGNKNYANKQTYILSKSKIVTAKELFKTYTSWTDREIKQRRKLLIDEMYNNMWT